ncbi:MAG: hypothetical protein IIT46_17745 [Lachnospiraceae bacterium]|nr:hypothetical protein [Lachnospiraceae bacterium]
MIYVDIVVPVLDKVYDFTLEENAPVSVLVEEIAEIIAQKEQCEMCGIADNIMLVSMETSEILPQNKTLNECGVHTGSRILLG